MRSGWLKTGIEPFDLVQVLKIFGEKGQDRGRLCDFFSILSRTQSIFTSFESAKKADQVHAIDISGASLAGMSARSKGGGGLVQRDVQGSGVCGEAPEPIESYFQFATSRLRERGLQGGEEQQASAIRPLSPKKRKVDVNSTFSVQENGLIQTIKDLIARASRVPDGPIAAAADADDTRSFRAEVGEIKKERIQLKQLMNEVMAVLQTLKQETRSISTQPKSSVLPRGTAQTSSRQACPPVAPVAQPSWANITESGAGSGWTTVTRGKKKLKKHPRDQRRVLFVRNVQSHKLRL